MVAVLTANNRAGRDNIAPPPAVKENGDNYNWRMFFDDGRSIADADTLAELIDLLIPGYLDTPEEQRIYDRLDFARSVQTAARAAALARASQEELDALEEWELALLQWEDPSGDPYGWEDGSKPARPAMAFSQSVEDEESITGPDMWSSDVPLVLIDAHYAPYGAAAPPLSSYGDFELVPNIVWLEIVDEKEFLQSLHRIGLIHFGVPAATEHIPSQAIED